MGFLSRSKSSIAVLFTVVLCSVWTSPTIKNVKTAALKAPDFPNTTAVVPVTTGTSDKTTTTTTITAPTTTAKATSGSTTTVSTTTQKTTTPQNTTASTISASTATEAQTTTATHTTTSVTATTEAPTTTAAPTTTNTPTTLAAPTTTSVPATTTTPTTTCYPTTSAAQTTTATPRTTSSRTTTAAPTTTDAPSTTIAPTTSAAPATTDAKTTAAAPITTAGPTATSTTTTTKAPTSAPAPTATAAPTTTVTPTITIGPPPTLPPKPADVTFDIASIDKTVLKATMAARIYVKTKSGKSATRDVPSNAVASGGSKTIVIIFTDGRPTSAPWTLTMDFGAKGKKAVYRVDLLGADKDWELKTVTLNYIVDGEKGTATTNDSQGSVASIGAPAGQSFACESEVDINLGPDVVLKAFRLQIEPFLKAPQKDAKFGTAKKCVADEGGSSAGVAVGVIIGTLAAITIIGVILYIVINRKMEVRMMGVQKVSYSQLR